MTPICILSIFAKIIYDSHLTVSMTTHKHFFHEMFSHPKPLLSKAAITVIVKNMKKIQNLQSKGWTTLPEVSGKQSVSLSIFRKLLGMITIKLNISRKHIPINKQDLI